MAEKHVEEICILLAEQCGYRLALKTRFTNLCLLFWAEPAEFVRVDIEGDLRWRFFPVVSAAKVLAQRRMENGFFVSSPVGEALVLASNIACANRLSDRYRKRMDCLWEEIASLKAVEVPEYDRKIISMSRKGQTAQLRRFLIRTNLQSPLKWPTVAATFLGDLIRLSENSQPTRMPGSTSGPALDRFAEIRIPNRSGISQREEPFIQWEHIVAEKIQ